MSLFTSLLPRKFANRAALFVRVSFLLIFVAFQKRQEPTSKLAAPYTVQPKFAIRADALLAHKGVSPERFSKVTAG